MVNFIIYILTFPFTSFLHISISQFPTVRRNRRHCGSDRQETLELIEWNPEELLAHLTLCASQHAPMRANQISSTASHGAPPPVILYSASRTPDTKACHSIVPQTWVKSYLQIVLFYLFLGCKVGFALKDEHVEHRYLTVVVSVSKWSCCCHSKQLKTNRQQRIICIYDLTQLDRFRCVALPLLINCISISRPRWVLSGYFTLPP